MHRAHNFGGFGGYLGGAQEVVWEFGKCLETSRADFTQRLGVGVAVGCISRGDAGTSNIYIYIYMSMAKISLKESACITAPEVNFIYILSKHKAL